MSDIQLPLAEQINFELENKRHINAMEAAKINYRMEVVRLAQQVVIENARNRPVNEREITADEIEQLVTRLTNIIGV